MVHYWHLIVKLIVTQVDPGFNGQSIETLDSFRTTGNSSESLILILSFGRPKSILMHVLLVLLYMLTVTAQNERESNLDIALRFPVFLKYVHNIWWRSHAGLTNTQYYRTWEKIWYMIVKLKERSNEDYLSFFSLNLYLISDDGSKPGSKISNTSGHDIRYEPIHESRRKISNEELFGYRNIWNTCTGNSLWVPRGQPGHDPLNKVRPVLNHLKNRFSSTYLPHQNITVDEAMIPFKGRLFFRQYMPAKPTKFGIKVWEVCDSTSGFCLDFDIYTGKSSNVGEHGLGYDVTTRLVSQYYGKNHHVYIDRFFSSLPLAQELLRHNTYVCGTVMLNRKGLPKNAKTTKLARGEVKFYQKDKIILTTWKDKRQVNILSTNCSPMIDDALNKPACVQLYNVYMGGVDKNDQLCTYYRVGRASHKWWRYVFWFAFNISITNSWLLWKESNHQPPELRCLDHLKFVVMLADQLRGGYTSRKLATGRPSKCIIQPISSLRGHNLVKIRGRQKICRQCVIRGRRTNKGRKKETSFECRVCRVAMCRVPCFHEFHGLNEE